MPLRYAHRTVPIQFARPGVDDRVVTPGRKIFLPHRQAAHALPFQADLERSWKLTRGARRIVVHRQHELRQCPLRQRRAIEDDLACAYLDQVAGQADHALDIILAAVVGRDYDDVATFRQASEYPPGNERERVGGWAD